MIDPTDTWIPSRGLGGGRGKPYWDMSGNPVAGGHDKNPYRMPALPLLNPDTGNPVRLQSNVQMALDYWRNRGLAPDPTGPRIPPLDPNRERTGDMGTGTRLAGFDPRTGRVPRPHPTWQPTRREPVRQPTREPAQQPVRQPVAQPQPAAQPQPPADAPGAGYMPDRGLGGREGGGLFGSPYERRDFFEQNPMGTLRSFQDQFGTGIQRRTTLSQLGRVFDQYNDGLMQRIREGRMPEGGLVNFLEGSMEYDEPFDWTQFFYEENPGLMARTYGAYTPETRTFY